MSKYLLILLTFSCLGGEIDDKFLFTLGQIESNNNDSAVGDGGKAIGRYQIWESYYKDAKAFDKTINFPYSALTNKANSDKVVKAYLNRYGKNKSLIEMARIHNGGPNGHKKSATLNYATRFQRQYEKANGNLP